MKTLLYAIMILATVSVAAMTPEARRSFHAFEQRAENGDPEAQYRLSIILEEGFDTIPADTVRSLSLLRRSATAGYAPAMNYLGFLYRNGFPGTSSRYQIVRQDLDSARYWLHRAAAAGDAKAAHNLAYLLLYSDYTRTGTADSLRLSEGSVKSDSLAVIYLTKASEAGLPQSQTLLADLFVQGRGVEPDTLRAITLYEKGIRAGFEDAELRLLNLIGPKFETLAQEDALRESIRYLNLGAPVISATLLLKITSAISRDSVAAIGASPILGRAYALLGHAYSHGQGVPYDYGKGNECFALAAILGDPSAQFIFAETLEIFPDALDTLLPTLSTERKETLTPQWLRERAAKAGITTAEAAKRVLLDPETVILEK